jgi:hypothetical protein
LNVDLQQIAFIDTKSRARQGIIVKHAIGESPLNQDKWQQILAEYSC